jgi:hypothetical protein
MEDELPRGESLVIVFDGFSTATRGASTRSSGAAHDSNLVEWITGGIRLLLSSSQANHRSSENDTVPAISRNVSASKKIKLDKVADIPNAIREGAASGVAKKFISSVA